MWRDDDNLFDYEGTIEHSYEGITSETTFRVRVEMIIKGQTGNCARVRDVTVTPGDVQTAVRRYPPGAYPIPFAPEPAGGTPVPSASTCDDCTGTVPLGFNFVFFGNTYNTITISSNGFASFDPGVSQGCCTGQLIPQNDSVNNMIALNWDDLYPGGGGSVTYDTRGSAPNRRFVLTFQDTPWCCGGPGRVTTQMILYEGTNYIEVHTAYRTLRGFARCTQGVEDATGSTAYFIPGRVVADYSLTNDAVLFSTN